MYFKKNWLTVDFKLNMFNVQAFLAATKRTIDMECSGGADDARDARRFIIENSMGSIDIYRTHFVNIYFATSLPQRHL